MNELDVKILALSQRNDYNAAVEIEFLLEQALKEDPDNVDLLLRLAVLEFKVPFSYHIRSIECLERILELEPNHAIALILLAAVNYYSIGIIEESLFIRLTSISVNDATIASMLKYVASWYCELISDVHRQEQLLKDSIELCQQYVDNYQALAAICFNQKKYADSKFLVQKALNNVVKVYQNKEVHVDITDVHEFLSYYIKGICLTTMSFRSLKFLEAEAVLKERLIQDPLNVDVLLGLARLEISEYSVDLEKRVAPLEKVLNCDPDNVRALLLLAYGNHSSVRSIDEALYKKLISIKTNDPEQNAMLLYVASWYHAGKDAEKQEELLRRSIQAYSCHVRNYFALAELCDKENQHEEAAILRAKALNNVVKVFVCYDDDDSISDFDKFLNESIKQYCGQFLKY